MERYYDTRTGTETHEKSKTTIDATDKRVAHFFNPLKAGEHIVTGDDGLPYTYIGKFVKPKVVGGAVVEGEDAQVILQNSKDKTKAKLNASVADEIVGGFKSSALGAEYSYKSGEKDQLNLMGAVMVQVDDYFKCGQMVNGEVQYVYKMHTVTQLKAVFDDGANTKKRLLQRVNTLKQMVYRANTVEEVEAISWEDTVIAAQAD